MALMSAHLEPRFLLPSASLRVKVPSRVLEYDHHKNNPQNLKNSTYLTVTCLVFCVASMALVTM